MLLLLVASASAATLDVCATCTYTTVGDAVAAASSGDTIQVDPGVYDETDLVIDKALTLIGAGSDVTTLRSDSAQVLYLGASYYDTYNPYGVTISGFDLQPSVGDGIVVDHVDADITDLRVDAAPGDGVRVLQGVTVAISDSAFNDLGGTAIVNEGTSYATLVVTGSSFERNARAIQGSWVDVESCTFFENGVSATWLHSSNNTFCGGEALYVSTDGTSIGDTFTGHSAAQGAAVHTRGWFTIEDAVFVGNTATVSGADVYADVAVEILDSTISGSTGGSVATGFVGSIELTGVTATNISGGCAFTTGSDANGIVAADSTFSDIDGDALCTNHAVWTTVTGSSFSNVTGTAVRVTTATDVEVTVSDSTFSDNGAAVTVSPWDLGGTASRLVVSDSRFSGHSSRAISGSRSSVTIEGSVFEENAAGALAIGEDSDLSLRGSRFCGNNADYGAAVYFTGDTLDASGNIFVGSTATTAGADFHLGGSATLRNNTLVGAYAPEGAGVWSGADLEFHENIVAYASEYALYGDGGTASITYNDFWEVTPSAVGGAWSAPDSTNLAVDPGWSAWQEGGGCDSLDLGLSADSALVDAGDPAYTDADGTRADIGATGGALAAEGTSWWYRDADGDGFGVEGETTFGLTAPSGYVAEAGDCDDADGDRFPGNPEVCDGADQDCDADVDEEAVDTSAWAADGDGDGFTTGASSWACTAPDGSVSVSDDDDCDDADASIHPDSPEVCDGIDNNCHGGVDEGVTTTWRRDLDGDGWHGLDNVRRCDGPDGYEASHLPPFDCDDADAATNPGGAEICDGIDQDCDGEIDEGVKSLWRPDGDGDGYLSAWSEREACEAPEGWHADSGDPYDCDDGDADVFPGSKDIPNDGIDQDCDGADTRALPIEPLDTDEDLADTDEIVGSAAGGACGGCSSAVPDPGWALLLAFAALRTRRSGRSRRADRR